MTNFKVGQKVVCVNDEKVMGYALSYIKRGDIYTVKNIYTCSCGMGHISLIEIEDNGAVMCGNCLTRINERHYMNNRFRPVIYNSATKEILEKFKLTEEKADVEIKEYENA